VAVREKQIAQDRPYALFAVLARALRSLGAMFDPLNVENPSFELKNAFVIRLVFAPSSRIKSTACGLARSLRVWPIEPARFVLVCLLTHTAAII
jgi:hypothetical protein